MRSTGGRALLQNEGCPAASVEKLRGEVFQNCEEEKNYLLTSGGKCNILGRHHMWQPDLLLLSPAYHQLQQRHWCHLHRQLLGRLLYVFVLLISMLPNRAHVYTPSLAHWQVFAPAPPSLKRQASLLSPRPSVASQTIRRSLTISNVCLPNKYSKTRKKLFAGFWRFMPQILYMIQGNN